MAPIADGNEVIRKLVAFPLIREVVHLEAGTGAAVFAESAGAIEHRLSAQLPGVAAQVSLVLALPLLPRFAPSATSPRLKRPADRREHRHAG